MIHWVILKLQYIYGAITPKQLKMVLPLIKQTILTFFWDSVSWRASKSLYWVQKLRQFCWTGGFCLLVELHREGLPWSLRSRLVHWCNNLFIILWFRIFKTLSIPFPNRKSWGAKIWGECSPPTMFHMSHVMPWYLQASLDMGWKTLHS